MDYQQINAYPYTLPDAPLFSARQNVLVDFEENTYTDICDPTTFAVVDLSSYTYSGSASLPNGTSNTALTFDNDLANGIVKAYLTEANSTALYAAALAAGVEQIEWDIKRIPAGGESEQVFMGVLIPCNVVTP